MHHILCVQPPNFILCVQLPTSLPIDASQLLSQLVSPVVNLLRWRPCPDAHGFCPASVIIGRTPFISKLRNTAFVSRGLRIHKVGHT
mmetsp:Transcript_40/g.29  ORF Transcript_40/g.29 Transcript_40/m.29 type:complete len:87 (-) Transcript_40:166-426(-)